ncbi:MAG TPA: hypothetical protein VFH88_02950 [Candidatus Krumholzibacteria bacterium]|nr:hypothetical protein [Candidatus Krumholzibacteria bacterium]
MTKMAVMPPRFDLQKVGVLSGDLVTEMNHDIEMVIKEAADTVIAASSLSAADLDLSDQVLADHPELRTAIFEQDAAVKKVHTALAGAGKEIDIKYEGNADPLADAADCDYLVFMEGNGFFSTTGAEVASIALAALFGGGSPQSGTFLSAFVVDVTRQEVIWYNQVDEKPSDPRKPTNLLGDVKKLFKPLLGKSFVQWDDSRDHEITDRYKERMKAAEAKDSAKQP